MSAAVRGLAASKRRSRFGLNAIAVLRANTMHRDNADQIDPLKRLVLPSEGRTEERKRQGEESMTERSVRGDTDAVEHVCVASRAFLDSITGKQPSLATAAVRRRPQFQPRPSLSDVTKWQCLGQVATNAVGLRPIRRRPTGE